MNFYDDVNEWLSVGGDLDVASALTDWNYGEVIEHLSGHGVTHVLDLRNECDDADVWEYYGLAVENYCHVPIVDSREHTPDDRWFTAIEDFVQEFWRSSSEGDRLYVHCQMGINRGPSAAMIALLYTYPSMTAWEAFEAIRSVRPVAGVVYAKYVGIRHIILGAGGWDGDKSNETYRDIVTFTETLHSYWSPEQIQAARAQRWWAEVDEVI